MQYKCFAMKRDGTRVRPSIRSQKMHEVACCKEPKCPPHARCKK